MDGLASIMPQWWDWMLIFIPVTGSKRDSILGQYKAWVQVM